MTVLHRSAAADPVAITRSATFWTLVVLSVFSAVSALGGGLGILTTGDLGMPGWFLGSGPFRSYTVPGIVLLVIVGGTQTLSAYLHLRRRESALLWTAVAAFGMIIWIAVELAVLTAASWLQWLYLVTAIGQLVAVLALLGVAGWMPRTPLQRVHVR